MNKNSHNSQATRVHETMQQSDYKQQIKAKQRTFNVSASLHHENITHKSEYRKETHRILRIYFLHLPQDSNNFLICNIKTTKFAER